MSPHPAVAERTHRFRIPLAVRIPWSYFVTGSTIVGRGDNASFLHDATEDFRGKPVTKLGRARWRRVLRRNLVATVPALLALAAITPWSALWVLWVYLAGLASFWGWRGSRAASRGLLGRRQRKEWVYPAAQLAARILNVRYTKRWARTAVDLPKGWGTGDEGGPAERQAVRLAIPAGTPLSAGLKAQVTSQVGRKLGIANPQAEWSEAGQSAFVDIMATPTPPKEVTWASLQRAIRDAAPDEVVLGRGAGGRLATISLSEDAPHVAMSGASGTGKSVLGRVFAVQRVGIHGDGMLILDPKRWSHWRWAGTGKVDPNRIRYAWRTEELHQAWLEVAAEAERRMEMDEDDLEKQRRVFVMVEEINTQTKRLTRYWKAERRRIIQAAKLALADDPAADIDLADLDPPLQSPAIVAMQESVAMGREIRMHVVVMAQRLSAAVFGGNGGDIRESFQGGRLIAKWDRKLWKMLVDTIAYVACPTGPRGIWGLARGEDFLIFRVPWLSEPDARAFVSNGVAVSGPVLGQQSGHPSIDGQTVDTATRQLANGVALVDILAQLPGQDGPDALSIGGLRKAASREGFPEPLAKPDGRPYGRTETRLYDAGELIYWREGQLAKN